MGAGKGQRHGHNITNMATDMDNDMDSDGYGHGHDFRK